MANCNWLMVNLFDVLIFNLKTFIIYHLTKMKFVKILFVIFILCVIALGGVSYWIYTAVNTPQRHDKANQFIQIPKGSSPTEIIDKLAAEGIVKSSTPTLVYLRTFGDPGKLKAGEYQFDSPITPLQVLKELEKGEERTIKLTIPEGFTRFDIAKRVAVKFPTNPPSDEKTVLALMDDTTLIKDLSPTEKARALGRTPQEIVTIASLIETESKFDEERAVVASVIYNRLSKNMALGIDQTAVYIAKMQNRWDGEINVSDLEVNSPYNTRKYAGIPPGPISSVSLSALEAALNPKQTDYILYVLNAEKNDGSHNFYSSYAEFEKGKAVYQIWLDQQRRKKSEQEANN